MPALNNLGYILLHRGELDEAELFLKRAIDIKSAELDTGNQHGYENSESYDNLCAKIH